ncbi:DUF3466 family protein [Celerinatantimonas sp. MCCC 1A17872]|uniref:DUF3466 family protein n=1 Tax=Celerinatantimonas sp. MCCC 1A17872 TaxID=3177514 RepID=UPI0038C90AFF
MKLKKLLRYLPLMALLTTGYSFADVTVEPYFDVVKEIPVGSDTSLSRAQQDLKGAAMSADGDHIAANAQYIRTPFRSYDINRPYTFQYGCQYSTYICDLDWEGDDSSSANNGFYDYREAIKDAFNNGDDSYSSYFLAMVSGDSDTSLSSDYSWTNSSSFPYTESTSSTVLSRFYGLDSDQDKTHDTVITGMTTSTVEIGGVSNKYWVTGYDFAPGSKTLPTGFVESLDGTYRITLTPSYTDTNGGLSAGYTFLTYGDTLYVAGMSSTAAASSNNFERCYEDGDSDGSSYYQSCPGIRTNAAVWSLGSVSFSSNEDSIEPTAVGSDWLDSEDNVPYTAAALDANSYGALAGYSTYDDNDSNIYSFGASAVYTTDGSSITRYQLSGTGLITNNDDDDIRDQWAVGITNPIDSSVYVIGNERYTTDKASSEHNQAVNMFISKLTNVTDGVPTSGAGTVQWPLKNHQFTGANNEIIAIDHDTGIAVGRQDASSQTQTSYNGVTRRQQAFLFDVPDYMADTSNVDDYVWSLASLTCYTEDGTAKRPYYRITNVRSVSVTDKGIYVLASGTKFSSKQNIIDGYDGTPVVLQLIHSDDKNLPVNSELSSCPSYEADTGKYSRQGADSIWLTLLLIPVIFVRLFTKQSKS